MTENGQQEKKTDPAAGPPAALAPKAQELGLDIIGLTVSSERKIATAKYEGRNAFLSVTVQIPRRADPDQLVKNLFIWVNAQVDAEEKAIRASIPAQAPPPTGNGNGNGNGQPAAGQGAPGQAQSQPAAAGSPPACPVCGKPMTVSKKFKGWYCAHKDAKGKWCTGTIKTE